MAARGDDVLELQRAFAEWLEKYVLRVTVSNIPAGTAIPCYVTWVWEDSDRDDADGPSADINPWYVLNGAQAPACDPCN